MTFDAVLMLDWSGGNDRGATPKKDAIWGCVAQDGQAEDPVYLRNRQLAEDWIIETLTNLRAAGKSVLVGIDLCFAYPTGFATKLVGSEDTLALWDWFEARVTDSPKANNRFDLAGEINAQFPGVGPFWFNGLGRDIPDLPRKGTDRDGHGLLEKRAADMAIPGSFSPWQLAGAGAVGGQVIMGLPVLARLRRRFLTIWLFGLLRLLTVLSCWQKLISHFYQRKSPQTRIQSRMHRKFQSMRGHFLQWPPISSPN